ncbi:hypothetical protein Q5752_002865 [Cryptotrichosporon argae]
MVLSFSLPPIHDNEDGSWGPSSSTLPAQFKDIPYAPFSKSDKITRIADWHDPATTDAGAGRARPTFANRRPREAYGAAEANAFGYVHDEDEKSFSLVDSGNRLASRGRGASRGGARTARGGGGSGAPTRGGAAARGGRGTALPTRGGYATRGGRGGFTGGRGGYDKPVRVRDSSVTIGADWGVVAEVDFARLAKLSLAVDEAEDVGAHGTLQAYDRAYDRVTTRAERPLEIVDRLRYNPSASDDPVLAGLADTKAATVFATDGVLAVLMCAPRSVNSWDIVFERRGDQLFLDKRDGGAFDFVTVNENAGDNAPADDAADATGGQLNTASALSLEATYINHNFASQVISPSSKPYTPSPNPFHSADDGDADSLASALYRYRKFDLSVAEDEELSLVVRTEVDAYVDKRSTLALVRALNEYDPRAQAGGKTPEWRKGLETQRGAIVANEMKNNSAKLARWAVQGVLAGADQIKMGFITRANPRDAQRHTIVGVHSYKPLDFARQMNVSLANGWGIVRTFCDLVLQQPEGKYVLVKDPNAPSLKLYSVPADAFDAGDDEFEE